MVARCYNRSLPRVHRPVTITRETTMPMTTTTLCRVVRTPRLDRRSGRSPASWQGGWLSVDGLISTANSCGHSRDSRERARERGVLAGSPPGGATDGGSATNAAHTRARTAHPTYLRNRTHLRTGGRRVARATRFASVRVRFPAATRASKPHIHTHAYVCVQGCIYKCARTRARVCSHKLTKLYQHCATRRSHTLVYLPTHNETRTHASHSSLLSLFLLHSFLLPAPLSRGNATRMPGGMGTAFEYSTSGDRDALVDVRMKVEVVAHACTIARERSGRETGRDRDGRRMRIARAICER